tara:strand:+ start:2897 stop:4186 length:1290 start_codon:yes stop_codon:yes gene_type:complete
MPQYIHRLLSADNAMHVPGPRPSGIADTFWNALFQYQKDTVATVINRFKGRCMLAHDMGLGKTVQAIAIMQHYGSPVLVLCPAFLKCNWQQEILKWAPELDVHIQSYDSLRTNPPLRQGWKLVVADEAHYIKQREAQRTAAAMPVLMECDHALLMTGTPCPNRPEELFVPMHVLRPAIVRNFHEFAKRYCDARKTRFSNFDTTGTSRKHELAWLLKRAFMLRLKKQDVLHELPEKICSVAYIKPCNMQAMIQLAELQEQKEDATPQQLKFIIGEMFRQTCQAKLKNAVEYVLKRAEQGPIIVFAHHKAMLDEIQNQAVKKKFNFVRIDGETPLKARQDEVNRMQLGNTVDIAVLSMGAAGVGFTLTSMSRVVFAELPWNPAVLRQCEDRIYRIGQKNACRIEYLICNDTLDEYVWKKINCKEKLTDVLI